MANDPILDAINGHGAAVADQDADPILSAITGSKPGMTRAQSARFIKKASSGPQSSPSASQALPTSLADSIEAQGPNLFLDTGSIPRNPFTNQLELSQPMMTDEEKQRAGTLSPAPQPSAPKRALLAAGGVLNDIAPENTDLANLTGASLTPQAVAERAAALQTGPQTWNIPKFNFGSFHTPMGPDLLAPPTKFSPSENQQEVNQELSNPAVPKTRASAFWKGFSADGLKDINDMFLSPLGLTATALGAAETIGIARAGNFGVDAARLAQDYQAMEDAGASAHELDQVRSQMRESIAAAARAQKMAVAGKMAGQGAAVGFGAQGAGSVASGIENKSLPEVLSGAGQLALGGAALAGAMDAGTPQRAVQAETAQRIMDNMPEGDVTAKRVQQVGEQPPPPPVPKQLPSGAPGPLAEEREPLAPQSPAGASPVGAGEKLAPESLVTRQGQVDALEKGTNPIVYFPKGTKTIPAPPENAQVTVVKGNKPGAGTYYHSDEITPQQIQAAVKDGTYGELLGNVQSKEEAATSGAAPSVVTARDQAGNELKASVVDASKPNLVAKQAETLSAQFPGATIAQEAPQKVVTGRLAKVAKPAVTPVQSAVSAQTPAVQVQSQNAPSGVPRQFGSRNREEMAEAKSTPDQQAQALRTDNIRMAEAIRKGMGTEDERAAAAGRIKQNEEMIRSIEGEIAETKPYPPITPSLSSGGHTPLEKIEDHPFFDTSAKKNNGLIDAVNSKDWWHVPPVAGSGAYAKRGKFYASSFKDAEFYGRPLDEADRPQVKNPLVGTEGIIAEELGIPPQNENMSWEEIAAHDREWALAAKEHRYDSIITMSPKDWVTYLSKGKIPKHMELQHLAPFQVGIGKESIKSENPVDHILNAINASEEGGAAKKQNEKERPAATEPEEEKPQAENLTGGSKIEAQKESVHATTEPLAGNGKKPLEEVPPEDVQRTEPERESGRLSEPRSAEDTGRVRLEHARGNEPVGSAERGGEEQPIAAQRGRHAEPGREVSSQSRPGQSGNDYRITEADRIGEGTVSEKFAANIEAIQVLKELEGSGRPATTDEQHKLVRYSGWGWSGNRLDEYHDQWRNERRQLRNLLTDDEYRSAVESTKNAHYTSPQIIKAVWDGLRRLGFTGGRILEPSAGVGHFLGLMPNDLFVNSRATAIELDTISGKILKQLYQTIDARIQGFEKLSGLNGFYDLAVSNVPFGDYGVHDPAYNKLNLSIHNYFITKMLDKVRPGGLVAAITSHHTLDAGNPKIRQNFLDRANPVGAIRLPGGAFEKNAGTDVTTDLLFFQRRRPDEKAAGEPFIETSQMDVRGKYGSETARVNEYYSKHPEMALGEHSMMGTMRRGAGEYKLLPGSDPLEESIARAVENLPENVMKEFAPPASVTRSATIESIPDWGETKPYGYAVKDGKVYQGLDGKLVHMENFPKANIEPLKKMLDIRNTVRELFKAEGKGRPSKELSEARGRLNRQYDSFVKKHGFLNQPKNTRMVEDDPDGPLLAALEKWDAKKRTAAKSDVFYKQTIAPRKEVTSVERPEDALPASLAEKGKIDFGYMSKISGVAPEKLQESLLDSGLVFRTPPGHWETKDEYLSGDVRQKLRDAEDAAKIDPQFKRNVDALKSVQPRDLEAGEISVRMGSPWIPEKDVADFIDTAILNGRRGSTRVTHVAAEGIWKVENRNARWDEAAQTKWGTPRMRPLELIEGALNLRRPTVYDRDGEKSIVNEKETLAARDKAEQIEKEFSDWIFKDPERARRLVSFYNDNFNNLVDRQWDGSHLTFPGMNAGIVLRPSQVNGAWRANVGGNTLLAHVVGSGKTFTIIASAMEARRIGLAKKPMVVVPNHLVEQWASDFQKLYPQSRVLAATKDQWSTENRKKLMSRIATGDWDAVIVPHSSFTLLPVRDETFTKYMQKQLDMIEEHIRELTASEGRKGRTVKELAKAKARIESRMKKALNRERKDNTIDFEDTGIDRLYVDEAHAYKNLFFSSKMGNINGIPKSDAQRSMDMYIKTKYISDLNNGSGVVFATGTPISNTMAEIYTMMRYMNEGMLERTGLSHFDSWAAAYGQTIQNMEVSPEDPTKFRISTRFAKFNNVAELKRMFRQNADVILSEDLKGIVETPQLMGGKPTVIEVLASQRVLDYIKQLGARATAIRKRAVRPDEDNMLKITSEGRKVALDYRSMFPGAEDDGESKISSAAKRIAEIYHETRDTKRTQAVMLDLMTPSDSGKKRGQFNSYADLKNKLVGLGIPAGEIAFIHDAKSDGAKQELFDKVNAGDVAVIIGSSDKMGVGTNIQERLLALHHVDAPWRPSDIEQREGRIVRQGNKNPVVQIYRYVTKGTFDAYMWNTIARKAQFIHEMMQHGYDVRQMEDADSASLSYAEVAALATGDTRVLDKVKADAEVAHLSKLKTIHDQQNVTNRVRLAEIPLRIAGAQRALAALEEDIQTRKKNASDQFRMQVGKNSFSERKDAGTALNAAAQSARGSERVLAGRFDGFDIIADANGNLHLEGRGSHFFQINHENPLGTIQSMERTLSGLEGHAEERREVIQMLEKDADARRAEIEKPFPKEKEFQRAIAKQKELNEELAVDKEDKTMSGAHANQEFDENFKKAGPEITTAKEGEEDGLAEGYEGHGKEAGFLNISPLVEAVRALGRLAARAITAARGGKRVAPQARQPEVVTGRPKEESGDIPLSAPGSRPVERAANIRLDKLNAPEDVLDEVRRIAKERSPEIDAQRRGHIPFSKTRDAAQQLVEEGMFTEKDLKHMQAGASLNAEELLAARSLLVASARRVRDLAKGLGEHPDTDKVLEFQRELLRHAGIQKAVSGAVAEAGRALSQQRMVANALSGKDKSAHERILEAMGGQDLSEEAARRLAQIPEDDPVALNNFLRSQKYWTTAQKIEAYWIANVLSSPRTPIKKVLGDSFLGAAEVGARFIAGAIDPIIAAIQGRPREYFFREPVAGAIAYVSAIPEATRKAAYIIAHGFDYDDLMKMEMPFKYEFAGGLKNPLNFGGRALAAATKLLQVTAFQSEIHAQAVRESLKRGFRGSAAKSVAAGLVQHPTDAMVDAAYKQAQFQTYTEEPDSIARWFMSGRDKIKLPSGVPLIGGLKPLRFIIPFVQIPYNLAKDAIRYSPFGAARLNDWDKAKSKDASMILGRALFGTAIMGLFAYLAAKKLLTGAAPTSSAERDDFYRSGKQPFSIRFGNRWVSYKAWGPFALTAAATAAFHDSHSKLSKMNATDTAIKIGAAMGQALLDESFLRGLKNVVDALSEPDRFASGFASGIAGGFVPMESALRTLNDALDPTVRSPKTIYERIVAGLPVVSKTVSARLDALGRPSTKEGSRGLSSLFPGGFAPATPKSDLDEEIDRLQGMGLKPIGFSGKSLTVDSYKLALNTNERQQYQSIRGKYLQVYLDDLFKSDEYSGMTDADKVDAAESAIRDAEHDAREQMIDIALDNRRAQARQFAGGVPRHAPTMSVSQ